MKENKGITLIALVITIIVLLILAGISLAMLSGPNGLLTKGNEAAIETVEAEARECAELAVSAVYQAKLAGGNYTAKLTDGLTQAEIVTEMTNTVKGSGIVVTPESDNVITYKKGDLTATITFKAPSTEEPLVGAYTVVESVTVAKSST